MSSLRLLALVRILDYINQCLIDFGHSEELERAQSALEGAIEQEVNHGPA